VTGTPAPGDPSVRAAQDGVLRLDEELLGAIVEAGEPFDIAEGAWLWREGDGGDSAVVVLEGLVDVVHENADGEAIHLRTLGPGSLAGELACLDGLGRSASVRARTACNLIRVEAEAFKALVVARSELRDHLFWIQVGRVRSLTSQVNRTHHRAITDSLTSLYNFGFFRERLNLELARAQQTADPVSLVLFDIDHFKHFNDTHGHQEGNRVLTRVAEILRTAGRRGDIVARFGGEEFVLLLYGATKLDSWLIADGLREKVEAEPFSGEASQPSGRLTISAGVATFPEDAATADQLIDVADARLYEAKNGGRNRVSGRPKG
jgi:diguanylate cyclase (GGDEF)-like protein